MLDMNPPQGKFATVTVTGTTTGEALLSRARSLRHLAIL